MGNKMTCSVLNPSNLYDDESFWWILLCLLLQFIFADRQDINVWLVSWLN